MPIFATAWVANCNWCHAERNSDEGVLSLEAFLRVLDEGGWKADVDRRACEVKPCTCPSCAKQGRV